ncbi:cytoplasmic protein [Kwoniella mangroviensis CBS 10435]|uniref:Cytoplasmic protein n=1 Tax=Kwoniella mangroviensis CBS 10435 TaxID=1331196 RepID=A0A1B9IGD5_9TREE|nr:cytoplasmic protein [Kwoniella mangroviensis CBS 10435]
MSRPTAPASRPGGASKPSSNPGPTPAANIPRRNPGTLPGLARTASSLRQGSPLTPSSSTLASLPAHLRNLSAPKIPSPLGRGTPARGVRQSLPSRTSKTTERHVLLPEDPQLAPLPKSPMGSQVNLLSSAPPRAAPSTSTRFTSIGTGDERSDAEKMTKREREENKLPRLTAYATAEGYRLKLLQAFLKREHGVGVVRVFDDCVYAVYNLPLLPGYGASTKVRSSPAVKSPGGVSLLERMTMAEDLGYNDSYFPREDPSEATPAEYILSATPPSPNPIAHGDLLNTLEHGRGESEHLQSEVLGLSSREQEEIAIAQNTLEGELRSEGLDLSSEEIPIPTSEDEQRNLGTHEDNKHPGHLEHIPSQALEPSDLPSPSEHPSPTAESSYSHHHQQQHEEHRVVSPESEFSPQPQPSKRPRRKSHTTQNVAEAVFFSYGVSVFFGFSELEEREIMEDCETASTWVRGLGEDDWEIEEFHYVYDSDAEQPRIYNDMFTFKSHSHLFKLSLAHAIAQSNKLSIYESVMQETLSLTASFPKELSTTGHLQLTRREALKMTGRLFKLRMDVNLIGGILDTPELFWSEASLFPLYEAIHEYLEIGPRIQVLNDRLAVAGDLLEIIHEYIEERATHRITWVIIWLIVVACFVEAGEVIARLVFHAIPRETGEFLLYKAPKMIMAGASASASGQTII